MNNLWNATETGWGSPINRKPISGRHAVEYGVYRQEGDRESLVEIFSTGVEDFAYAVENEARRHVRRLTSANPDKRYEVRRIVHGYAVCNEGEVVRELRTGLQDHLQTMKSKAEGLARSLGEGHTVREL